MNIYGTKLKSLRPNLKSYQLPIDYLITQLEAFNFFDNVDYRLIMRADDRALFVDATLNQMKWHLGKTTRKKSTKTHGYIRLCLNYVTTVGYNHEKSAI